MEDFELVGTELYTDEGSEEARGGELYYNPKTNKYKWKSYDDDSELDMEENVGEQLKTLFGSPNFKLSEDYGAKFKVGETGLEPKEETLKDVALEEPSVDKLLTEDARKSAAQQRALYASGVSAISAAGALPSLLTFIPSFKSEVEKQAEETIEAGVQEMTGAEEAQLKQMTSAKGALRESRMRGEGRLATGLGNVLTSVADATQAKVAQVKAQADVLQQQGMFIAQEKAKAIQQSLAEIRDAQMTDYAMARERKAAAQTMADSLGKALAFYGSYQMPQVDPDYAKALDMLGPDAPPEAIDALRKAIKQNKSATV